MAKAKRNIPTRASSSRTQKTGRWSTEEQLLFLHGLALYGRGNWKKFRQFLPTRSSVQIKSHAQKILKRADEGKDIFIPLRDKENVLKSLLAKMGETYEEPVDVPSMVTPGSSGGRRSGTAAAAAGSDGTASDNDEKEEKEDDETVTDDEGKKTGEKNDDETVTDDEGKKPASSAPESPQQRSASIAANDASPSASSLLGRASASISNAFSQSMQLLRGGMSDDEPLDLEELGSSPDLS